MAFVTTAFNHYLLLEITRFMLTGCWQAERNEHYKKEKIIKKEKKIKRKKVAANKYVSTT